MTAFPPGLAGLSLHAATRSVSAIEAAIRRTGGHDIGAEVRLTDGWIVRDFFERPRRDQLPRVEHAHPVGDRADESQVVLDDNDRETGVAQRGDHRPESLLVRHIDAGGRRVEEQYARVRSEGASDLQDALLGVRERFRVHVCLFDQSGGCERGGRCL